MAELALREVTDGDELHALAPVWRQLFAAARSRSPFLSHEWVSAWWDTFGGDQELAVLLFEDDAGAAGVAPLARARRRLGPIAYRALELIGTGPLRFLGMGLADRADLVCGRRERDCLQALVGWLAAGRRRWDVLDLRFVPDDSATATALPELARAAGLGCVTSPCAESPYLPLDGTWDDYLGRRSRNFRKGLKRKLAKLEASGEVRFDLAAERTGDVLETFARVVETSRRSWKEEAGSALFLHEFVRRFFTRLLPALNDAGLLYIALCTVGGEVVAHELGFRLDRKLWSYDSGFRRDYGAGSPGTLLTARVLERAFGDGLREYDFLRGDEGYKETWQTASRRELQIVLDAGTARARLLRRLGYQGKWWLKRSPRLLALQARLAGVANRVIVRREPM